jgi:hypothetical protein
MAPDVKRIATEYVQKQLKHMDGKIPAQRQINAAVRKVAAVIQEIRTAAARQPKAKSS